MSSSSGPALKNSGREAEIPEDSDQAVLSFADLKKAVKLLVQTENSSLSNRIAVLEREMALLKLKIARPQALAMKPRVLQLLELSEKKEEAELSEKKEEAELSEKKEEAEHEAKKKEEAEHEAKKRELLLEAEKKRSYKEGEPSTWLVEGWSSEH